MSGDRGTTMQRGPGRGVGAQPPWTEPTAPAARKLPGPPRERKPLLAALAVLLIVLGAGAAALIVTKSDHRVGAIEISRQVARGQQFSVADMREVQIASGDGINYVSWDQAAQVARYFAATTIPAGTVLTPSMADTYDALPAGKAILGLALKDGQLPSGLAPGDHVNIYESSDSTEACPGQPGSTLSHNAVVLSSPRATTTAGASGMTDVKVALSPSDAGAVACSAANGLVGIAVLPSGTGGQSGGTQSSPGGTQSPGAGQGTRVPAGHGKGTTHGGGGRGAG